MDTRYVDCEIHGPHRRAYLVCNHILDTRDRFLIDTHKPWSDTPDDGIGVLCCALGNEAHRADNVSLMCEDTLLEIGILLPGETRLT